MKIIEIKQRNSKLLNRLLKIWESAVRTTHFFLTNEEINHIKEYVPQALIQIPILIIAKDENENPIGFMGIKEQMLVMLFIDNEHRGKKIGKQLLQYGIQNYSIKKLAVNEQNPLVKGFYEHMGFKVYKKTKFDEQGNPYPLLYMQRD